LAGYAEVKNKWVVAQIPFRFVQKAKEIEKASLLD